MIQSKYFVLRVNGKRKLIIMSGEISTKWITHSLSGREEKIGL